MEQRFSINGIFQVFKNINPARCTCSVDLKHEFYHAQEAKQSYPNSLLSTLIFIALSLSPSYAVYTWVSKYVYLESISYGDMGGVRTDTPLVYLWALGQFAVRNEKKKKNLT